VTLSTDAHYEHLAACRYCRWVREKGDPPGTPEREAVGEELQQRRNGVAEKEIRLGHTNDTG
jgi:hypothetical protein